MAQKFCAEHGWLFLIHIVDYGILCIYCKKRLDTGKHQREGSTPALRSKHFCADEVEGFPFDGTLCGETVCPQSGKQVRVQAGKSSPARLLHCATSPSLLVRP